MKQRERQLDKKTNSACNLARIYSLICKTEMREGKNGLSWDYF